MAKTSSATGGGQVRSHKSIDALDWFDEMKQSQSADPSERGTVTTQEVARFVGLKGAAMLKRMKIAASAGVIQAKKVNRVDAWGDNRCTKGWAVVDGDGFRIMVEGWTR